MWINFTSNGVCEQREVVIVLPGGMVCEGLLFGSAAAFGGDARTDPEGGSGETYIAWAGVGRACWE